MGRPPGSAAWGTVLQYECGVCLGIVSLLSPCWLAVVAVVIERG